MVTRAKSHVERIEDGIVGALKAELHAEFLIDHFPVNPAEFDRQGATSVALVQYAGSTYAAPRFDQQLRAADFVVHLELSRLDQHHSTDVSAGGAADIEHIRLALQGREIEGCPITMVRDGLVAERDGVWTWEITVRATMPAVPIHRPRPRPAFVAIQPFT